ncbi:response regulator [Sphingomonas sp. MS122]|uniref:response regulator n=1 Tax=Sphingomonas sp. MS122 TaxID=3412683 RepID=UPI003C2F7183
MTKPRILVADDHPLMLSGIEAVLRDSEFEVVGTARDGAQTLDMIPVVRPDMLILDIAMPVRTGMDVVRTLRARHDKRGIVLLTAHITDADLIEALDLKVQGILPKEGAETLLIACLREIAAGGQWIERSIMQRALSLAMQGSKSETKLSQLTLRERSIAQLITRGLRNRDIGIELGVTEGTVKLTLHRIFAKLDVANRVELAMLMQKESELPKVIDEI